MNKFLLLAEIEIPISPVAEPDHHVEVEKHELQRIQEEYARRYGNAYFGSSQMSSQQYERMQNAYGQSQGQYNQQMQNWSGMSTPVLDIVNNQRILRPNYGMQPGSTMSGLSQWSISDLDQ